jgi:hypothetical protein
MVDALNNDENDESEIDSIPKFKQMVLRGTDYREEYEFALFGEEMTILISPLDDDQYTTLLEQMEEDIGDEKFKKIMQEADGKSEEEAEEDFDIGFINAMQTAAKLGIDHESVNLSQEEVAELVDQMVGGESIKIGREVMELTSNVSAAEEFPGGR